MFCIHISRRRSSNQDHFIEYELYIIIGVGKHTSAFDLLLDGRSIASLPSHLYVHYVPLQRLQYDLIWGTVALLSKLRLYQFSIACDVIKKNNHGLSTHLIRSCHGA